MIDIGAIAGGISSLKAAKDIAGSLVSLRDTAKFQAAVVELQGKILSAQSDQFELIERVRELETKLAKLKAWESEKSRYRLTDFGSGTFAYVLKSEAANGEPPHQICANCYNNGAKSILQFSHRGGDGRSYYQCFGCKSQQGLGAKIERSSAPSRSRPDYF